MSTVYIDFSHIVDDNNNNNLLTIPPYNYKLVSDTSADTFEKHAKILMIMRKFSLSRQDINKMMQAFYYRPPILLTPPRPLSHPTKPNRFEYQLNMHQILSFSSSSFNLIKASHSIFLQPKLIKMKLKIFTSRHASNAP